MRYVIHIQNGSSRNPHLRLTLMTKPKPEAGGSLILPSSSQHSLHQKLQKLQELQKLQTIYRQFLLGWPTFCWE
jgi:hypothetical protein